ncbi:MAG: hypothetical protein JKX69_05065 [Rhodobacteraceae bacterium]|nr:hypothetical protein [Paracoccaceae bacterium]
MKRLLFALACSAWASLGYAQSPEFIETGIDSELYMSDAVYYPADGARAVVWVPGFIFNKESWASMARALQERNVASLAISGKVERNVRQAIRELVQRGYQDIILVGASSGAAAVLNTMEQVTAIDVVSGVVMLSPVRGNPMDDQTVRKLIIVSQDERAFDTVAAIYAGSMEPRELLTIPGAAHAQFLFFGPNSAEVTNAIIDFIVE